MKNIEQLSVPEEAKLELKNTLEELKGLLNDNPDFFLKLINKCLLVGKDLKDKVYFEDIETMLEVEYPGFTDCEVGVNLLQVCYNFVNQLCFDSEGLVVFMESTSYNFYDIYRDQLDQVVYTVCDISAPTMEISGNVNNSDIL